MGFEQRFRRVCVAMMMVDDITSGILRQVEVTMADSLSKPVFNGDGFCVFTDVPDGTYALSIQTHHHRPFFHDITIPLSTTDDFVLDVPGENESFVVVQSVDLSTRTITFATRDFRPRLAVGTAVISNRFLTTLAQPLEGTGIVSAVLTEVVSGAETLQAGDLVRFVDHRIIRMLAGPYYPFLSDIQRVSGTVTDSVTGLPLASVVVELRRVNNQVVQNQNVGTSAGNRVRLYTVGTGPDLRVIGRQTDVRCETDVRGRYLLYFLRREDLIITDIRVRATLSGYQNSVETVSFSERQNVTVSFSMVEV